MGSITRRQALALASAAGVQLGVAGTSRGQESGQDAAGAGAAVPQQDDPETVDPNELDLAAARAAGMSEVEVECWASGNAFARSYLSLPALLEGHEHIHAIHVFQSRLLMRPGYARYREAFGFGDRAPPSGGELDELAQPVDGEAAEAAGLLENEVECWHLLAEFAEAFRSLAKLHPLEDHEVSHALHELRAMLLARPVLRAYRDR